MFVARIGNSTEADVRQSMMICVGSTNPVKINAVITAASETWPSVQVTGIDVPSGVSSQPRSDAETRTGARNRALAALHDGLLQLKKQNADGEKKYSVANDEVLGVGMEGGVFENEDGELWTTVWCSVVDQEGAVFESNGARFKVPDIIAERIQNGEEMGPITVSITGKKDVRYGIGMIGVITAGFVDRTEEYSGIAKMALGLWYGRDWEKSLR